jgi:integrase
MASLENRNSSFRIVFRFAGQKYSRSLRTRSEKAAQASLARLEDNLRRLELGTLQLPDDSDVASFLLSDGQQRSKPKKATIRTLQHLCDRFLKSIPEGALEESTVAGMEVHIRHLKRLLCSAFAIRSLGLESLQGYVDARAKEDGQRGKNVSAATIKKELRTLRGMWNWARNAGHFDRVMPQNGLRFPKISEKPQFQTWAEIERKIARGGLSEETQAGLWDCLFLTLPEIAELLDYVKATARHSFIYPMFVFACHTGARRSEMMRSRIEDVDISSETATIREKKRVRGKLTTRTVPLSPLLLSTLSRWLSEHAGGQHTFSLDSHVVRSKKSRDVPGCLTR